MEPSEHTPDLLSPERFLVFVLLVFFFGEFVRVDGYILVFALLAFFGCIDDVDGKIDCLALTHAFQIHNEIDGRATKTQLWHESRIAVKVDDAGQVRPSRTHPAKGIVHRPPTVVALHRAHHRTRTKRHDDLCDWVLLGVDLPE